VIVERLELTDFRNYHEAVFALTAGVTAVLGDNGHGKTNLAEALGYLATLSSFRGVSPDALIRIGAETAVVRAVIRDETGRESLIEAEIAATGRSRVQINRQRLAKTRDLLGFMRVTVFSPDDLMVVKGGPGERRRLMDEALVALALRYDATRLELERILKQRNRLLKQAGGRADDDVSATLDVWDARLVSIGTELGDARAHLVNLLGPLVTRSYSDLADRDTEIAVAYRPAWRSSGLAEALRTARDEDLRRAITTVGPHRDDLELSIDGLASRTHASQGEQRTLALAVRLGIHRLIAERTGTTPVVVLDDVLSELDPTRAAALLGHVPDGQVVITSAAPLPPAARPDRILRISAGAVVDDSRRDDSRHDDTCETGER